MLAESFYSFNRSTFHIAGNPDANYRKSAGFLPIFSGDNIACAVVPLDSPVTLGILPDKK